MRAVIAPQAADDPAMIELAELSGNSPSQYLAEQAYRYQLWCKKSLLTLSPKIGPCKINPLQHSKNDL